MSEAEFDNLVTLRDMAAKELAKNPVFPDSWQFLLNNGSLPVHALTLEIVTRLSRRDRENILWLTATKYRFEQMIDFKDWKRSPSFLTLVAEEEFNLALRLLNF